MHGDGLAGVMKGWMECCHGRIRLALEREWCGILEWRSVSGGGRTGDDSHDAWPGVFALSLSFSHTLSI